MPWSYSDLLEGHHKLAVELSATKTENERLRNALELIATLNGQPTAQDIAKMNLAFHD